MVGREEKERLHHPRMPYTSAVAGGAMVRLVNGVPKIQNPRTGKWIKVGGTLYRKLFREGRLSASSPARLQPIPTGRASGAPMIKGHGIETDESTVVPPYYEISDENNAEAKKEEIAMNNAERDEKHEENIVHAMANQALQIDAEKMIIVLQTACITSSAEQDRIIQDVQARNAGYESHLREMQAPNREAIALASLPKTAISPETTLPLMADLAMVNLCLVLEHILQKTLKTKTEFQRR